MFFIKISILVIFFGLITAFIVILFRNYSLYSDYVSALDRKEFFLKELFPFGLYFLDRCGYTFNSSYDRKTLSYMGEIYGQEYSAFYARVFYANKIVLLALCVITEFLVGGLSMPDRTLPAYMLLLSGIFFIYGDFKLKNRVRKRRLHIQLEFPEFINKLTLLLNAGLTMSKAWEKISADRTPESDGGQKSFYLEVEKTVSEIKTGKNEEEAFSQFAKRAKTPEISRLMSTIMQNTKRGGNDLVLSLRLQAGECWEMRKNAIRRMGEEASTKLLFPMMLMFFAIVIIVVTPAVISMQGIR